MKSLQCAKNTTLKTSKYLKKYMIGPISIVLSNINWAFSDKNAPSVRNCNVVQYALDTLGFNDDRLINSFGI